MPIVRVLRRVWIPPVVVVVIGCWGFAMSRVRAIFASEKHLPDPDSQVADELFHPKSAIFEVLGPVSAVAGTSDFDSDSEPHIDRAQESFERRERLQTLSG
jgi:hypothetical protein